MSSLCRKDVESLMSHSLEDDEKAKLLSEIKRCGNLFETGFIVTDPTAGKDSVIFVNDAFTTITGYSFEEIFGENLQILHGEDTDMELIRDIDQRLSEGKSVTEEILHYNKDGNPFWSELVIQPIFGQAGEILFINSFILDITRRKISESLLQQHKQIFIGINEGKGWNELLQTVCDTMNPFFLSKVTCAYLFEKRNRGWIAEMSNTVPKPLSKRIEVGIALGVNYIKDESPLLGEVPLHHEHDYVRSWSLPVFDQAGQLSDVFIVYVKKEKAPTDVHLEYLKGLIPVLQMAKVFFEQQEKLRYLEYFDFSTGLPNRNGFLEQLKKRMKKNVDYFVAVIEPSEYTSIIDFYGRDAADDLFIQLARRIEKNKGSNFVGRLSSTSLIITKELKSRKEVKQSIALFRMITAKPFVIAGEELFITLKAGISLSGDGCSAEEMLRHADIAFTTTKNKPGGTLSFYKDVQNEEAIKGMKIANELMKALVIDGLDVYLQPKVNLKTEEIIGFEALARWNSSVLGEVSPRVFIPVAENTGKIIDLEINVLTKIMSWQRERMRRGEKMYQVAVNISVDHFFHPSFVLVLKQLLSDYGVQAEYIQLEMTESIGLVDFNQAKQIFERLNELKFKVSIDDFGVGYSSLSYLSKLQVSELKIDQSFINELDKPDTHAIVTSIVQLAHNLNLVTVAEGIEEAHQIEALISLGCQVGQGFYYYEPMPLDKIDLLLG